MDFRDGDSFYRYLKFLFAGSVSTKVFFSGEKNDVSGNV
jgi:hypothetical protein